MDDSNCPERSEFHRSETRTRGKASRDAVIAAKARKIPNSARGAYLRAATGKDSPRQAIKAHCLECVGYVRDDVRNCTAQACPLYFYRPYQNTPLYALMKDQPCP